MKKNEVSNENKPLKVKNKKVNKMAKGEKGVKRRKINK